MTNYYVYTKCKTTKLKVEKNFTASSKTDLIKQIRTAGLVYSVNNTIIINLTKKEIEENLFDKFELEADIHDLIFNKKGIITAENSDYLLGYLLNIDNNSLEKLQKYYNVDIVFNENTKTGTITKKYLTSSNKIDYEQLLIDVKEIALHNLAAAGLVMYIKKLEQIPLIWSKGTRVLGQFIYSLNRNSYFNLSIKISKNLFYKKDMHEVVNTLIHEYLHAINLFHGYQGHDNNWLELCNKVNQTTCYNITQYHSYDIDFNNKFCNYKYAEFFIVNGVKYVDFHKKSNERIKNALKREEGLYFTNINKEDCYLLIKKIDLNYSQCLELKDNFMKMDFSDIV